MRVYHFHHPGARKEVYKKFAVSSSFFCEIFLFFLRFFQALAHEAGGGVYGLLRPEFRAAVVGSGYEVKARLFAAGAEFFVEFNALARVCGAVSFLSGVMCVTALAFAASSGCSMT